MYSFLIESNRSYERIVPVKLTQFVSSFWNICISCVCEGKQIDFANFTDCGYPLLLLSKSLVFGFSINPVWKEFPFLFHQNRSIKQGVWAKYELYIFQNPGFCEMIVQRWVRSYEMKSHLIQKAMTLQSGYWEIPVAAVTHRFNEV